jgi:aryl-alcohol dehydrogenase-like predicted oxidoreductase
VIECLKRARERGYTRFIGYSGDSQAALYAVNSGEFDTLQTSISIADQEALDLTVPLAKKRSMGVIVKRPLANVAWANGDPPPRDGYGYPYWERLRKLKYNFLRDDLPDSATIALRFVLAATGVHTAIVGTTNPERYSENASALETGALPGELFESIRSRWREIAGSDWVGQT